MTQDEKWMARYEEVVGFTIEALEPNSVIFECKEGPFVEHEVDGILVQPKK